MKYEIINLFYLYPAKSLTIDIAIQFRESAEVGKSSG